MMILRKAELTDFETYKILYEDNDCVYQWLYIDETINEQNFTEDEKKAIKAKIEQEFGDFSEEYENELRDYTLEKFEETLLKDHNFVYMIEKDCKIIGYVKIVHQFGSEYRIEEIAMFNAEDNTIKEDIFSKILGLKLPKLRIFSICTDSNSVGQWLLLKGFKCSSRIFYKLEVKTKKER